MESMSPPLRSLTVICALALAIAACEDSKNGTMPDADTGDGPPTDAGSDTTSDPDAPSPPVVYRPPAGAPCMANPRSTRSLVVG